VENASSVSRNKSIIKEQIHTTSDLCTNISTIESSVNNQPQTTQSKIMENFIIVWLCSNINGSLTDRDDLVMQLRHIINGFKTYTDINECIDFLTNLSDEKVVMIINDYPDQNFLPLIDHIPQLHSIYIFDNDREKHEQITKEFKLLRGTYSQIEHICSAVKQDAYRLVVDLTPISVISPSSSLNLDELDQSFMYTQLLKEIIIDIEYDAEKAREEFTQFYLSRSDADGLQPNTINQFQQCYEDHSPIWWYTKEWFIYSSLNRALRTQDVELITKMGFFVQDLHRQIERQHRETHDTSKVVVYRGQALSNDDFEKLRKSKGGLFSFNNFLSTSLDRDVSLLLADSNQQNHDITAILFKMEIDPSISSTPFARIGNIGQFNSEAEILFSMHTVFRIGDMNKIGERLWEVNLKLTSDSDQQLKCLTDYIRSEIGGRVGWLNMAMLMHKIGKYDKIIEIVDMLKQIISDEDPETLEIFETSMGNDIGMAQQALGNYSAALSSYEKLLKVFQDLRPYDHSGIAILHCNIGLVYRSMGDFSSALFNFEKALESQRQSLSPDSNLFAKIYNNIALTHLSLGSFSNALTYFEKALEIQQKSLPSGHPDLAMIYNNIGLTHGSLGNYSTALSYFEKTLEIQRKSLPSDHPHLAITHNSIAIIHRSQSSFPSALTHFEKALEILQKSLPSDHPDLAAIHNNIGAIHRSKGDHATALFYYEKTLNMCQKTLPPNHPNFANTYNNMGAVHQSLGNYSTALWCYEKTLEIQQKSLPSYHPDIVKTYNNITSVSQLNQDYSSAASNAEKAFKNHQKLLSVNQLSSTTDCSDTNKMMETYSELFSDFKRVAKMQQKLIPSDGSNFTVSDENIGEAEEFMETYSKMILNAEKALEFEKKYPLVNQPLDPGIQVNSVDKNQMIEYLMTTISHLKKGLGIQQETSSFADEEANFNDDEVPPSLDHFSLALSPYQKMLEIQQKYSSPNDASLSTNYNTIGQTYYSLRDYVNALSFVRKGT
jgi:tetratricopeptide (TPR) repeat protein